MKNSIELLQPVLPKKVLFSLKGIDNLIYDYQNNYLHSLDPASPDILAVGIGLENICNYKCTYCYAGRKGFTDKETHEGDVMSLNEYEKIVTDAGDLGAKTLVICGDGEPLLSKKILQIIDYAYQSNMHTVIFTNASILGDEYLCNRIHHIGCHQFLQILSDKHVSLMVKCDTIDKDKYETITGGSINVLFNAINNIKNNLLDFDNINNLCMTNVGISMVITRDNFKEIIAVSNFANSRGFQYVCKFPSFMGNALDNKSDFFTPEEASELYKKTLEFVDKRETMLVDNKYCLINQLGISINKNGIPLLCLSSRAMEHKANFNIRNYSLKNIVLTRKQLSPPVIGDCPKKSQWYIFKKTS